MIGATGLNQPQGIGVDASGNVFVASANSGSVVEFPATGGAGVTIISGLSYNKGLTVDSLGNVYSTSYGGNVTRWPAGGGTASTFATGSACPDFAAMGYYIGFYDLTADGSGNIYAYGGNKYLLEFNQSGACTERLTPTQIGALSPSTFASDSKGNIYFSAGSTIYSVPVGSTTPTPLAIPSTAFASINALTIDAGGNLYVTDANSIDEIPMQNGALNTAAVTYLVPAGASFNIGISPSGVLYYGNFNANTVVKTVIGSLALGSSNVGTAGTPGSLTYTFNAAVTPTNFTYVSSSGAMAQFATSTNGTTCAAGTAYPASTPNTISNCTLNVALTPATPGRVLGGVLLQTASGTLATTYLSGSGTGPGLTVDPGTQTALGSFQTPTAVRVDGSGNVLVADSAEGTVTEFAAGSTTGTVVASGLDSPQGLAVDGAGNLFIADTGNDQIVEVPVVNGALAASAKSVVASSLNTPLGLAIDQAGDLLIANSGGGNVLELPNQGGVLGSLPAFAVGSGFSKPVALAVDGTGTIFVGDGTLGNIYEISPVGAQSNVLAGYSQITGLAVDANDDLFLTQNGVSAVTKIALINGAYAANATSTVGAGLKGPQGVAVDSAGNVYIADAQGGAAYQVLRTAGAINFGKVNIGSSSAAHAELPVLQPHRRYRRLQRDAINLTTMWNNARRRHVVWVVGHLRSDCDQQPDRNAHLLEQCSECGFPYGCPQRHRRQLCSHQPEPVGFTDGHDQLRPDHQHHSDCCTPGDIRAGADRDGAVHRGWQQLRFAGGTHVGRDGVDQRDWPLRRVAHRGCQLRRRYELCDVCIYRTAIPHNCHRPDDGGHFIQYQRHYRGGNRNVGNLYSHRQTVRPNAAALSKWNGHVLCQWEQYASRFSAVDERNRHVHHHGAAKRPIQRHCGL
jgi:sugar lactone lactonase YvrE